MAHKLSYSSRADLPGTSPLKNYLLNLMAVKKSNLCLSADVTSSTKLLRLAEVVGDSICILKTHADIIETFSTQTVHGLIRLSKEKKFLIFEDRKFGDIGNTVQLQYTRGPFSIAQWAHLVNCHIFPGPAIVAALSSAAEDVCKKLEKNVETEIFVGTPRLSTDGSENEREDYVASQGTKDGRDKSETSIASDKTERRRSSSPLDVRPPSQSGRKSSIIAITNISQTVHPGSRPPSTPLLTDADFDRQKKLEELGDPPIARSLLVLAEMSSEGNLMTGGYTEKCVEIARKSPDFVLGFIAQRNLNSKKGDNFLTMTPGVSLPPAGQKSTAGDGLGQQYRTPRKVILQEGCDVIIVGRGILSAANPREEAERYREEAWKAYTERLRA